MATLKACSFSTRGDAEAHYLALIDSVSAKMRKIDPAQAEVYREKIAQAHAGGGPLLSAEAAALGTTAESVRHAVLAEHERRQHWISAVEVERVKTKAEVRNATTPADMHALFEAFKQRLTLLQ